jgi:tetratricopeptide (TPR) repeat protein
MSDPLRTDPAREGEPGSDREREAKIEQLLLTGLEHYVAGRYDHAINIWTRALFLDRGHARTRAYIERARSAQAERQRESEELLQVGVEAFHRGDTDEARRLVHSALEQGARSEDALTVLDRLNRLVHHDEVPVETTGPRMRVRARGQSRAAWAAFAVCALLIVGALAFAAGLFRSSWQGRNEAAPVAAATRPPIEGGLPLPRRGETAMTRARTLVASGRLRDALLTLEDVRATDPQKAEADGLRAEIQRQLIAVAGAAPASVTEATSQP